MEHLREVSPWTDSWAQSALPPTRKVKSYFPYLFPFVISDIVLNKTQMEICWRTSGVLLSYKRDKGKRRACGHSSSPFLLFLMRCDAWSRGSHLQS